jgi:peptidoglycan/xylan/chitin deacetylase (PgdA/CDA1 family)
MSAPATLRGVAGQAGSRLAELLGEGLRPVASLDSAGARLPRVVAEVDGPEPGSGPEAAGLPDGAARAEALALRLRSAQVELRWGDPVAVESLAELLRLCRARGRSSVEIWRADPPLLSGLQLGAWFDAPWRTRLLRRVPPLAAAARRLALRSPRMLAAAADLAFWAGARELASAAEWRRLTSSHVVLVYHRFAGELKPGQERIDISPARFARQLRALRLAGFRPLRPEQLFGFHAGEPNELPRRGFAITVDDAISDCVAPLLRAARFDPQLFVPTAELGSTAHWIDGEPVADWEEVRELAAAGIAIGSHTRHHRRLTELSTEERERELAGSLAELRERVPGALEVIAYPNGDHDAVVCAAARAAGYRAAFTTEKGRNGAGTDPYRLRRVSVHGADGALAVLWKALTGEALPERRLRIRARRG